jgi:hypothetical protein
MAIENGLMNAVSIFIRQVFQDARENGFTERIRQNIRMTDAHVVGENTVEADIHIALKDAPEARAFELGSGLHNPQTPGLYDIKAKNARQLWFWWERGNKWYSGPKLTYGHPGVAPRPAMGSAMQDNLPLLRREIRDVVHQEIKSIFTRARTTK